MTEAQLIRIWRFVLIFGKYARFLLTNKNGHSFATGQVRVVNNILSDPEKMRDCINWILITYLDEKIKVEPPTQ